MALSASSQGGRREHQVGLEVGTLNLNTEPNPNNLNYRSIRVSGFEFGPDKFIIRSSTDRITRNLKYLRNLIQTMMLQLCVLNYFSNFFMNLTITCFRQVVLKSIELK
jgi:hypothetical protein